jgi:hypothetical protein
MSQLPESHEDMRNESDSIFSKIYREGVWGNGSKDSPFSGSGSNPDIALPYVNFVQKIIDEYKIATVLDVGHGDWAMWRDYKFENTIYTGIDVAKGLSVENTKSFGNKNRKFFEKSALGLLPDADLLLCKDVLQHLSLRDIDIILEKLSKFQYVIICNDINGSITFLKKLRYHMQPKARLKKLRNFQSPFFRSILHLNNSEIVSGGYRRLDLEDPYFSLRFRDFRIVERIDFNAEHTDGTKKRILFFKKIESIN